MYLKSIKFSSFQSFGKKTSLSFNTPITSIVGPNGSGKSNIVESIRFVLGEQSMKSLRGKGGVDLIFKGSKSMSSANRASVSITFDNSKKIFAFTNSGLGVSLDYDEVTISRTVFADGGNKYSINNTEVRLKDVIDLLASVNIGASGHHIISQGEADRVLNASSKDRRAMIEDALGLKIYQYRIKESERKLEKTLINVKEVQSLRREIAPHMVFLKKQVEKIEKSEMLRDELKSLYKEYISNESSYISIETKRLTHQRRILDENLLSIEDRISKIEEQKSNKDNSDSVFLIEIKNKEKELFDIRSFRDELARKLGRIEGIVEGLERQINKQNQNVERIIPQSEWQNLISEIENNIEKALILNDVSEIFSILKSMKDRIVFLKSSPNQNHNEVSVGLENELNEMKNAKSSIVYEMESINNNEKSILNSIFELRNKENELQNSSRDNEKVLYELMSKKNEINSSMHSLRFEEEKLTLIKNNFDIELGEAGSLIGMAVMSYVQNQNMDLVVDRISQEDKKRKIERIKIKLEDAGLSNSADVMREYSETVERDTFLAREVEDLSKSVDSLKILIQDLKDTLDKEFKAGIDKINNQFNEFFSLMFGGGSATLSVVVENKNIKKTEGDEFEEEKIDDESLPLERGVEINVSLPHKKVKDLHMLSGGERSLTSIALLFAMSQVNPPPFLVLDETDAALDEANSRKYGNMLENLSKYSQLIVVTHNRETMSRAQVLYGVTMDALGASKLLSIRLEDASIYAK